MAKAKTTSTKKPTTKKINYKQRIIEQYKRHVLTEGDDPHSVFLFAEKLDMTEAQFYQYFTSFESLKSHIWLEFFEDTLSVLLKDAAYSNYSSREKLLAFYYTLLEHLKRDRSFVKYCFESKSKKEIVPDFLKVFKPHFEKYVNELISEGVETKEIQKRPVIGDKYHEALWLQLLFVVNFWLKDNSQQFQNTDAAVEKAVTLSFDLMGPGPLDTMLDFAKFLYHNR